MNRFVIVGNGFDLAHDLPTRYEDFIVDYIKNAIKETTKEVIKVRSIRGGTYVPYEDKLITVRCITPFEIHDDTYSSLSSLMSFDKIQWEGITTEGKRSQHYHIRFNSPFFSQLINQKVGLNRWTDIENYYFQFLTTHFNTQRHNKEFFKDLNDEFEELEGKLKKYLKNIDDKIGGTFLASEDRDNMIAYCFNPLDAEDYNKFFNKTSEPARLTGNRKELDNVYFLNFNYTSLLRKRLLDEGNYELIPIHGEISNPESVIFGYGDDTHEKYSQLEQDGNEELLMNIKSFYYADNDNYLNIIDKLEKQEFEVAVVGHSLGFSDRVLLKTIFEHPNCCAIRLYHRGERKNHFKKRIALSRHFYNKQNMRGKIVPFNENDVFK
tara:strand:- start:3197 stop:4336 length:1140 start_codon:yes stop_codon:yes gene_type:complete